jgi:hypothetical protein
MHPPAPSSTWAGFRVKLGYLRLRVAAPANGRRIGRARGSRAAESDSESSSHTVRP